MVTREVPLTLGSGIEEANLDFEDERSEGKAVAMPQLINVLVAILLEPVNKCEAAFLRMGDGEIEVSIGNIAGRDIGKIQMWIVIG